MHNTMQLKAVVSAFAKRAAPAVREPDPLCIAKHEGGVRSLTRNVCILELKKHSGRSWITGSGNEDTNNKVLLLRHTGMCV